MLQELVIRNFAIIDDLHITLGDGLTIFSGETGAGKSIIINAVNLLLGSRASARMIRTGAEAAELEALFRVASDGPAARLLMEYGYVDGQELLVRRIISRSERHRTTINGRLATLQILNALTVNLASISGQHEHQGLLREDQHLQILDQFGGLVSLRDDLAARYRTIVSLLKRRDHLKRSKQRRSEHLALLEFQQKEIVGAAILPGEDLLLEQERLRLKNVEVLVRTVQEAVDTMYGAQGAVLERLLMIHKELDRASRIDPQLAPIAANLADTAYRVEDLAAELRTYTNSLQMDEERLEAVEERLDVLLKLRRKYGGSLEAVATHLQQITRELSEAGDSDAKIAATEEELAACHDAIRLSARQLSRRRLQTARRLARKVVAELATLEMARTRFEVELRPIAADAACPAQLTVDGAALSDTGIDQARFLIAPNVGEDLRPLALIASGGELSRVMLALKAMLAETESVETVVFDEVDAGIGGSVAEVVGRKLSELARFHQIICITHLPQIAKFGDHHFRIEKQVRSGRTRTRMSHLKDAARIEEIARMLGGEKITRATLDHAREMLNI